MKRKWLIVGLLGLAELALCAGILAVTWSGFAWARDTGVRFSVFDVETVSAEADEEQRFAVSGAATLDLTNISGSVQVIGGAGSEIVVSAHKTAWGSDQAEAEAALGDVRISMTQAGNAVTVKVQEPSKLVVLGSTRGSTVDFVVQVPAQTDVTAATGFGDVELSDVAGTVDLRSGAGTVTASSVEGDVQLGSDFGDVTLERATAGTVTASTSSGAVELRQVQAGGAVSLASDFGSLEFTGGTAAELTAETSSGVVKLSDLALTGRVLAHTDFGEIVVTRVTAPGGYDLGSSSGNVTVDGAAGSLHAETAYGDVSVSNAAEVTLELHTNSGAVTFAGTLGAGPHSLTSDFGNVYLRLPADTAATVELTTDFGRIRSDFPITLSGDLDDEHWQGTLNGGGPSLTVKTSSGNISLETLNS
jgi:DUF4097 and DUF4098 domain-containing protein YvlB